METIELEPARLGPDLAGRVAADLAEAIGRNGVARLAVPGGEGPEPFLTALGETALDWERVVVTLTDERRVPLDHPRSNQRLVQRTLFAGGAAAARFVPLLPDAQGRWGGIEAIGQALRAEALPLDVAVLGTGTDGHTASLIPDAEGLDTLLAPSGDAVVCTLSAASAEEERVTLTAPVLAAARRLYVFAVSRAACDALDAALGVEDERGAPLARVLRDARHVTVLRARDG
ncbi:MAG: 6-phosphogluconolactonase [Paracoccaceae bacterium]